VETIRKIQQTFGDDAMGSLKLMSGLTALKMVACWRTVTIIPEGRQ
jgi:5-keto 4-deoxyuronate isomerase